MKISQKKEDELWSVINGGIMDARIEILKLEPNSKLLQKVDDILYKVSINLPSKAIHKLKQSVNKQNT
jgi:hypothetical protein